MAKEQQLREHVASGVAWSIGEKVGSALMQIVVSIIVVNALMPMDMGIMAILAVFTAFAQVVVDSGFSQTLIRKSDPSQGDFRSVFIFNIATALSLYAIFTAISPLLANYYGWPMLAKVAPVLFLIIPLNAVCVIQNTIMVREFRFAKLSTIIFVAALISGIVAVVMALCGCGIWSLVGQRVSQMVVKAVLLCETLCKKVYADRDMTLNAFAGVIPESNRAVQITVKKLGYRDSGILDGEYFYSFDQKIPCRLYVKEI
jgi:O-antigen/teichoic acid export membrane protein